MRLVPVLTAALLIAGCAGESADNAEKAAGANNAATPVADIEEIPADEGPALPPGAADTSLEGWVGTWTGPEGLALEIANGAAPGRYDLTVTLLDGTERFTGTADGATIRFIRNGAEERIRKATGDETGLKYLAGKQDCLMIKPGEGFCRG